MDKVTPSIMGSDSQDKPEFAKAPRGKKSFGKGKGKGKSSFRNGSRQKPGNDFAFWNEFPELMGIATKFPWMHIAGTPLAGPSVNVNLPNVAVQHYHPIPGVQSSATSPLNLTFRQMYLDMHRKYRGVGTYQASDIAITILCIESALQLIVEAERVYGIINAYPVKSRIQPDGLLRAMGYTNTFITDIKAHMADYRYRINRIISLARRLPLPKGMNFCKNHISLNGFVYKDSKDERADLLVFVADSYFAYSYNKINSAGTACLTPFFRSTYNSGDAFLNLIETTLNNLLYDSDILRITSDFIACYGENNMEVLTDLDEKYVVLPSYDEAILSKWHNSERYWGANAAGQLAYSTVSANTTRLTPGTNDLIFCVYQENDVIYSLPTTFKYDAGNMGWVSVDSVHFYYASASAPTGVIAPTSPNVTPHIADTWMEEPDQATICEAMLWKTNSHVTYTSGKYAVLFDTVSTELLTYLQIFSVVNATATTASTLYDSDYISGSQSLDGGINQFDWHPYLFVYSSGNITGVLGDTDNVTVVDCATVSKIHDAALLSAFKVTATAGN